MPRNNKCFVHNTVLELTFRTQDGLPFPANPFIILILQSILARAQTLYYVTLCHFIIMPNHLHLIVVVEDPECVPSFVEYFKRESAHAVNRLIGRNQHTVWADNYSHPIVLDAKMVIHRIVYAYTNPQKANLVDTIEQYPHVSSWGAFLKGGLEIAVARVPRNATPRLPERTLSFSDQEKIVKYLEERSLEENKLAIDPDAWMNCFYEYCNSDPDEVNAEIIKLIRDEEERFRRSRKRPVLGAHALRLQSVYKDYIPKKFGKLMLCLSSMKNLRKAYIAWYREQNAKTPKFSRERRVEEWLKKLPPGFFAPGGLLGSNVLPDYVPTANNVILHA